MREKPKILICFGTRPEAIKMCPLIKEFYNREGLDVKICISGQHRHLVASVLNTYNISPDYNLDIMTENQTLFDITAGTLCEMRKILESYSPQLVIVHGDTTSALAASIAAFYSKIPSAHIEAGLRSGNVLLPFPEEFNRRAISLTASFHFAPTLTARDNLIREGVDSAKIFVVGNTIVDCVQKNIDPLFKHPIITANRNKKIIFLTAHRRENIGLPLRRIFRAVKSLALTHDDIHFIYPTHPNPAILHIVESELRGCDSVSILPPLDGIQCHNILSRSHVILTDSGGLQEEGAALGIPVLVMRDSTERPEGIESGISRLVGTNTENIVAQVENILHNSEIHDKVKSTPCPYGDGTASHKIADIICKMLY